MKCLPVSLGRLQALFAVLLFFFCSQHVAGQAAPTAKRGIDLNILNPRNLFGPLSAFGMVSETDTGFAGQNTAIKAGANLRFHSLFHVEPAIEYRATYPLRSGSVAGEEYFLYGPVLRTQVKYFHPYVNFLIGRGAINYQSGGFLSGTDLYSKSFSALHSPGGGVDIDLNDNWAVKADAQWQLWQVPVISDGTTRALSVSLGMQYRIHLPHFGRKEKVDTDDGTWVPLHKQYPGAGDSGSGTGTDSTRK